MLNLSLLCGNAEHAKMILGVPEKETEGNALKGKAKRLLVGAQKIRTLFVLQKKSLGWKSLLEKG